ncbi:hypothetical protein LX36DRAFT_135414 [Colletotrichum falcatum]|nr:hypothetical protein LX36DRAFT_135414 [Colletotrichum falcatum]
MERRRLVLAHNHPTYINAVLTRPHTDTTVTRAPYPARHGHSSVMPARQRKGCIRNAQLQKEFDALSSKVEPELRPDEQKPEPNRQASLQLATLGIALASKEKEAIQLERRVVNQEQDAGVLQPHEAEKRLRHLNLRHLSAGDDLWKHQKKKVRYGDVRLLDPRANALTECLLALYSKSGNLLAEERPSNWRRDALAYYEGSKPSTGEVWCNVTGMWHPENSIKVAHFVPHSLDYESIDEILFSSRSESLEKSGNALLMLDNVKKWFDKYFLVIVPSEKDEIPIRRWRVDIISPDIQNTSYLSARPARELDGKELAFRNDNRPVPRFLYFHFIMALIRIKDLNRHNWKDTWARYYDLRPFPTPGTYMRRTMLLALACHYSTTDLDLVDSLLEDHGFETPLWLSEDETTEAARRILESVEASASPTKNRRTKAKIKDVSESDGSSDEDSSDED